MNIKLTKGKAFELDPSKAYLIFLKRNAVSEADAKWLADQLAKIGVKNAVVALTDKGAYKIVEASAVDAKMKKTAVRQVKAEAKKNK